jgi:hypothetical protein
VAKLSKNRIEHNIIINIKLTALCVDFVNRSLRIIIISISLVQSVPVVAYDVIFGRLAALILVVKNHTDLVQDASDDIISRVDVTEAFLEGRAETLPVRIATVLTVRTTPVLGRLVSGAEELDSDVRA